jgi:hypothetical protein
MRRLALAFLLGLAPLPALAQSVTLDVCSTGTVDVDVFVSQERTLTSAHIRPSTCAAVAGSVGGGMNPAYMGLAFTDASVQWGAPRRFESIPGLGVYQLPYATRMAMALRGEREPPQLRSIRRRESGFACWARTPQVSRIR